MPSVKGFRYFARDYAGLLAEDKDINPQFNVCYHRRISEALLLVGQM